MESIMLNTLTTPHQYPGKLFVVEGIDGSGKTTQLSLLAKWLAATGHRVFVTEWNSSALVKAATKEGKKKNALTPTTFSLLHATDFADRLLYNIVPPLKAGMTVLADRYAYTAFARDVARGVDRRWVRELYSFGVRPDLTLYFKVPIDVSLDRLLARRVKLKFYEAGMDLGLSVNVAESFRLFQGRVLQEYDRIVEEYDLTVVDARVSITEQQRPRAPGAAARRPLVNRRRSPGRSDDMPADRSASKAPTDSSSPATTTATDCPTWTSRGIPAGSSPSRGPTASAGRPRSTCCASGSRSRATASSKRDGPGRR
jgi:dTMP kinase